MSINEAKKQLADAIAKYEHLKLELNNKSNLESYSEQGWHTYLRNLGLETVSKVHISCERKITQTQIGSIDSNQSNV